MNPEHTHTRLVFPICSDATFFNFWISSPQSSFRTESNFLEPQAVGSYNAFLPVFLIISNRRPQLPSSAHPSNYLHRLSLFFHGCFSFFWLFCWSKHHFTPSSNSNLSRKLFLPPLPSSSNVSSSTRSPLRQEPCVGFSIKAWPSYQPGQWVLCLIWLFAKCLVHNKYLIVNDLIQMNV